MSKEITKAYILQQLQDKFGLRELTPEIFSFLETVIPVYDIRQHLETWALTYKALSVTAADNYTFFTVPENERWLLHRYDVVFMGAGAYTVAGANIRRVLSGFNTVYLDLTAAQTESYHVELQTPVVLCPGDSLNVNVDGYTSTQNLRLYIDYMREEIR